MEETLDLDEEEAIEEDKLKRHQSTGYQKYSGWRRSDQIVLTVVYQNLKKKNT